MGLTLTYKFSIQFVLCVSSFRELLSKIYSLFCQKRYICPTRTNGFSWLYRRSTERTKSNRCCVVRIDFVCSLTENIIMLQHTNYRASHTKRQQHNLPISNYLFFVTIGCIDLIGNLTAHKIGSIFIYYIIIQNYSLNGQRRFLLYFIQSENIKHTHSLNVISNDQNETGDLMIHGSHETCTWSITILV